MIVRAASGRSVLLARPATYGGQPHQAARQQRERRRLRDCLSGRAGDPQIAEVLIRSGAAQEHLHRIGGIGQPGPIGEVGQVLVGVGGYAGNIVAGVGSNEDVA